MTGMISRVRMAAVVAVVAFGAAVTWACSEAAADGELCENGSQCQSGRCAGLTCEGSDCKCEGTGCRGRSTCREGWLCTRGNAVAEEAIPQCRPQCTGAGTCAAGKRCENGVCQTGVETFALAWVNIPRTSPCTPRIPCEYKVRVSTNVTIDAFTWTFGDAPPVETKEPMTSFTYPMGGDFAVLVRARASSGAQAELRTTEVLCVGSLGAACDPGASPCCEGSCSAMLVCR